MSMLRNLARRRVRTSLTVLGVTIGIWALVVFGSMANRVNIMVDNGRSFFENGTITVWGGGGTAPKSNPLDIALADRIAALPGVDIVVPSVQMNLSDDAGGNPMALPPMILGAVPGADRGRDIFPMTAASGRLLTPADAGSNVVVLGWDLAGQFDKHVGDRMNLRGEDFVVVGIISQTLTQPDGAAYVPLAASQRLYLTTLPALVRGNLVASQVVTGFVVYPQPGADPDGIAVAMKAMDPELGTMTPDDFDRILGSYSSMLSALFIGIALISVVVGGLSVVNTMAMSIAERTREIGIKRAIGASRVRIVREFVAESALIGLIGGLIGLAFGALVVSIANEAGRSSGTILFELTPGTAVGALAFATFLGALAGFVPSIHAARLDPVAALRYE
jgi:putative ABC transport system permease protein